MSWQPVTSEEKHVQSQQYESLDYDDYEEFLVQQSLEKGFSTSWPRNVLSLTRWLLTILNAFVTALIGYCLFKLLNALSDAKLSALFQLWESNRAAAAYFALLGICLLYTVFSSLIVVYLTPDARGGGFQYVLAYLNGTNVAKWFDWKTVLGKLISLCFAIAGGLTLGLEGPFVYIGAGVALILSKATAYFTASNKYTRALTGLQEERVFIAGGAAAGLAVAFLAPIAGTLLAMEASTSFLTTSVTLRIFVCALCASFFSDLGHQNFSRQIENHNLVANKADREQAWQAPELFAFLFLAVIGGLMGVAATKLNFKALQAREQVSHRKGRWVLVAEIAAITVIITLLWFVLPYACGCRAIHDECATAAHTRCRPLFCAGSNGYSDIGTLVFSTPENAARLLFDQVLTGSNDFRVVPLLFYALFYFALFAVTYGTYVAGGIFVPAILTGGSLGRAFALILNSWIPGARIIPGVYALIGAGAMLSGVTRLTLPIVVMLVEMTGDATYLLPIMIASVVAKWVADALSPALYPLHMKLEGIAILQDSLTDSLDHVTAGDLMSPAPVAVPLVPTLAEVYAALRSSHSLAFPVIELEGDVDGPKSPRFAGIISRRALMYALNHMTQYTTPEQAREGEAVTAAATIGRAGATYGRHAPAATGGSGDLSSRPSLDPSVAQKYVSLGTLTDRGALTIRSALHARRVATLFRRVGCSHLAVTDQQNRIVGMVTRRDLLEPKTTARRSSQQSQAGEAASVVVSSSAYLQEPEPESPSRRPLSEAASSSEDDDVPPEMIRLQTVEIGRTSSPAEGKSL